MKATIKNTSGAGPDIPAAAVVPAVSRNAASFNIAEGGLTVILGLSYTNLDAYAPSGVVFPRKSSKKIVAASGWAKIIDNLPEGTSCVSFSCGDEATLSCLPGLISRANKKGLQTHIETSGRLLTAEFVKKLKNSGLDTTAVNIESPGPAAQDKLKARSASERAVAGIKNCLREGISCGVFTHATKANLRDGGLKRTIRLAESLNVHFMNILPPAPGVSLRELESQMLGAGERKVLKGLLKKGFSVLEDERCLAVHKKLVYIFPNGDVTPCACVPFSFGNAGGTPLKTILKRMWKHPMCGIKTKECVVYNKEFRDKYLQGIDMSRYFPVSCV